MINPPIDSPVGALALAICYDLRFPQLSTKQRLNGAQVLTYPSAFTVPTGKAHWEVMLRARAIENQCWVVAAAQSGAHNAKRASYGHSMVVDPWGEVMLDMGDEIGLGIVDIDPAKCDRIRQSMPVVDHVKFDLYQ